MPMLHITLSNNITQHYNYDDGYDMELVKESGVLILTQHGKYVHIWNERAWWEVDITQE